VQSNEKSHFDFTAKLVYLLHNEGQHSLLPRFLPIFQAKQYLIWINIHEIWTEN